MADRLRIERSRRLYERGVRLIPGGSQTNSKRPENFAPGAYPVYIKRGEGCRVWDVDGNEYLDFIMALGPVSLGYRYRPVDEAVRGQMESGVIFGLMHPLEVRLAERITELVPCAEMVRFLKTGAEATSAAARIARGHTGREVILSCGYHGWLDTWMAGRPGVPEALGETLRGFAFDDLGQLEGLLEEHAGEVACVIITPSHTVMPGPGYMERVRELVRDEGALLVYDEIVTGFRLGPGGAQEHWGVIPDIGVFGKGIANGYPLACVAGRAECMRAAADLTISSTFGGETLSLAAACATLDTYVGEQVFEHTWRMGRRLREGFNRAARSRGLGMECLGYDPISSMRFTEGDADLRKDLWTLFLQETARRGVLMRRGGLNFISYAHTPGDIDRAVEACDEAMGVLRGALDSGREIAGHFDGRAGGDRWLPMA